MAASPQFASTPETRVISLSASATGTRINSQTASALLISSTGAGIVGTKITQIGGKFQNSNGACSLFIFLSDTGGTTASALLYDEITFAATTASASAASARSVNAYGDFQLQPGQSIYVSCSTATNATNLNVYVSGGDF
jgi:hypothetical protein